MNEPHRRYLARLSNQRRMPNLVSEWCSEMRSGMHCLSPALEFSRIVIDFKAAKQVSPIPDGS